MNERLDSYDKYCVGFVVGTMPQWFYLRFLASFTLFYLVCKIESV